MVINVMPEPPADYRRNTEAAIVSFVCFSAVAVLILVAIVANVHVGRSDGSELAHGPNPPAVWRQGELPYSQPVLGLWMVEGEIVTQACIRTDFAGIFELSLVGRPVVSVEQPLYWTDLPEKLDLP